MLKKLIASLVLGLGVCLTSVMAKPMPEFYIGQSNGVDFVLNPNESQILTNVFMWPLKANCLMSCENDQINTIFFKILKKTGSLNGTPLSLGDSMAIDIKSNDELMIIANSGSKVEMKNIGSTTIKASCNIIA
ncbi:MAG: hypothetical protein EBY16_08985 [Gammaproteobacteria bacterium]|nr:hypothetical protein [Gammaproteobacteria bacterium]